MRHRFPMKGGRSRVIPTSPPPSYRTCLDQTLGGPAHIEVVVRLGRTSGDRVKKTGSVAPLPSVSSSSHIGSSDYMPEKRNVRFCGVLTKEHRSAFHRASKFTRTNPISTLQSRWAACEKKAACRQPTLSTSSNDDWRDPKTSRARPSVVGSNAPNGGNARRRRTMRRAATEARPRDRYKTRSCSSGRLRRLSPFLTLGRCTSDQGDLASDQSDSSQTPTATQALGDVQRDGAPGTTLARWEKRAGLDRA